MYFFSSKPNNFKKYTFVLEYHFNNSFIFKMFLYVYITHWICNNEKKLIYKLNYVELKIIIFLAFFTFYYLIRLHKTTKKNTKETFLKTKFYPPKFFIILIILPVNHWVNLNGFQKLQFRA